MTTRVIVRGPRAPVSQESGAERALAKLLRERAARRPGFSGCWAATSLPGGYAAIDNYDVAGARVTIASAADGGGMLYHAVPWEYGLPDSWISARPRLFGGLPSFRLSP